MCPAGAPEGVALRTPENPPPVPDSPGRPPSAWAWSWPTAGRFLVKSALGCAGLFTFVLALQVLKAGARDYGSAVLGFLAVGNPVDSLGLGWLLAYVFLSGSPVAALAVSFLAARTLDPLETFTMIAGSRMGASFIVLLAGFLYRLRGGQKGASLSIGVLTLLVTGSIYLPAIALGYGLLQMDVLTHLRLSPVGELNSLVDQVTEPLLAALQARVPSQALIPCGLALVVLAFQALDQALPEVSQEGHALHRLGRQVYRPAAMFLVGAAITTVTLSVSVSLSVLIPLSNRGLIRRENAIPYIMGANVTTFVDTLFVALLAGGPEAFGVVLVEMLSVAFLSALILLFAYRPFEEALTWLQTWILQDDHRLVGFLALMVLIPLFFLGI